jgi:glutathione S-transferase
MAPAVKVFGPAKSTCVARVLICLEEVGAEYELVHVHIPAGEHKIPAHVARNVCLQSPLLSHTPSVHIYRRYSFLKKILKYKTPVKFGERFVRFD